MTTPAGQWVRVPLVGGAERWDWVPSEQPPSPDGRPGLWHVLSSGPGQPGTWQFLAAHPPKLPELLAGRARLATIFVGLATAASGLVFVLDLVSVQLLTSYLDDPIGNFDDVDTRDTLSGIGGVVWMLAWILAAVFFIRWLHLAYRNLDVLAPGARRHGVGWSIGSWFVPFLNLWRPKQIVDQVDRGTGGSARSLIYGWWAIWVVGLLADNAGLRVLFDADTVEDYRNADIADAVVSVLEVIAGVLAILVVRALTESYERCVTEFAERDSAGPMPPRSPSAFSAPMGDGWAATRWQRRGDVGPPTRGPR